MADYADFAFSMFRGDTEVFTATITQSAAPFNITGCSLRFTAKRNLTDTDLEAVFQVTTAGGGIVITDGPGGIAEITIASGDTSGLSQAIRCYCDLQLVDLTGKVSTTTTGTLQIKLDVTETDT